MNIRFVDVPSTALVELRDVEAAESAEVAGCLVKLAPALSTDERAAADLQAVRRRLIERGALGVHVAAVAVRDEAPAADERAAAVCSDAVADYVRGSAAAPEVRERALEIVASLLGDYRG